MTTQAPLRSLPFASGLGLPARRPAPAQFLLFGLLAAALLVAPLAFPRVLPQQVGAGPLTGPDGASALAAYDGGGLKLQSTQPAFSSPWQSLGGLQTGRGTFNGAYTDSLNGAVDDVSAYWGDPCPQPAAPPAVSTCSIT